MTYDAIVIGAGHNGLAAAVHLATRGWRVAVVEAADEPGGAVRTTEATLPGFRHDLYAMNLSLFAGSPFLAAHREGLLRHGLAFVPAPDSFASVFADASWLGVSQDLEMTAARIAAVSPADAKTWRTMAAAFATEAPPIFGLLGAPMPSIGTLRALWGLYRARGLAGVLQLVRLLVASPRDFLDRHFESDSLKAMMAVWGMHLDFPPDAAGGALFPYLESMACQSFGMVIGQGGARTMIDAMVGLLKERGGEVMLGTRVAEVLTEAGRATGVRLADGRVLSAGRAVVANVHPRRLFGDLVAEAPDQASYRSKLADFRPGPGTMMVHFAVSALPDWSAGAELKSFAYVHIAPSLDSMARAYSEAKAGLLPAEPVLIVGQPTALDPERAPAGRHVLWVQVRVLPAAVRGDAAGLIAGTDWDTIKETYADRVARLIERYAPGFGATVLGRAVLSPSDLERANPNLVGGDSLSGSHHLDQNFVFRPVPGWSRYRTPVTALYLCGASTWPGAGVGAGSGFMIAKMLVGP